MPVDNIDQMMIRAAQADDLSAILALLRENGLPEAGVDQHMGTVLVAYNGADIIGSIGLEIYDSYALLRSLAVHPSNQRQGVGRRLTIAALDLAHQRGIVQIFLLTETASDFFRHFDFQLVQRPEVPAKVQQSIEFISACPQSALVMTLKLSMLIA